ncbi:MAG: PaaI family thioesterase [Candidatus Methanomethylophilus sp.]|nr:PaaI family thioesterase [Methanomethylophilus sp.]MDD3232756.1 PaaI family thioesterase [Methanomethylophilus sp.]MDD4221804.1 PaaI family thioesterase [Methanomethylophilus sp.]MDD4668600.1 PaaI family thioesterase [Methanomethylophilus sp.]
MEKEDLRGIVAADAEPFMDNILPMVNAPYCVACGLRPVSITRDRVVMHKTVLPSDRNSNGFAHGGAIYSLMDHTFAILSNIEGPAVGQSTCVNFYRPGRGNELEAEARFINVSRSIYSIEVRATGDGKLIASGTFNAFRLKEIHK